MKRLLIVALLMLPSPLAMAESHMLDYLVSVSSEINRHLPTMLDERSEWVTTIPGSNSFEYRYRILKWSSDPEPGLLIKQRLFLIVLCRDKWLVSMVKRGVIIKISYYDENMRYIGGYEVNRHDCGI